MTVETDISDLQHRVVALETINAQPDSPFLSTRWLTFVGDHLRTYAVRYTGALAAAWPTIQLVAAPWFNSLSLSEPTKQGITLALIGLVGAATKVKKPE